MSPTLTTRSRWRHFRNTDPSFDVVLLTTFQHSDQTWVVVGDIQGIDEPEIYGATEFATKFDKIGRVAS